MRHAGPPPARQARTAPPPCPRQGDWRREQPKAHGLNGVGLEGSPEGPPPWASHTRTWQSFRRFRIPSGFRKSHGPGLSHKGLILRSLSREHPLQGPLLLRAEGVLQEVRRLLCCSLKPASSKTTAVGHEADSQAEVSATRSSELRASQPLSRSLKGRGGSGPVRSAGAGRPRSCASSFRMRHPKLSSLGGYRTSRMPIPQARPHLSAFASMVSKRSLSKLFFTATCWPVVGDRDAIAVRSPSGPYGSHVGHIYVPMRTHMLRLLCSASAGFPTWPRSAAARPSEAKAHKRALGKEPLCWAGPV